MFPLPLTLGDRATIYSQSAEGAIAILRDNAAALAEFALSEHI